jgi:tRNA-2-methylthio-N6-dimethylallyladenosine synthase
VGFPGETEEDFQATIDLTTQARFSAAYTYKYSIRPGTPAGVMPNQIADDVVGERYTRLHEHLQMISLDINQKSIGTQHRALVSEIEGRRDDRSGRITGRTEDFRIVHFDSIAGARSGDFVDVEITEASAHYLIGKAHRVIPTRGGDAHAARNAPASTMLGIPTVRS